MISIAYNVDAQKNCTFGYREGVLMTKAGAQISSLRAYLQTPQQMEETFEKIRNMGYRIVQVQWINPEIPPETVADTLRRTGLISVSTQDYYQEVRDNLAPVLRLHDLCGSKNICVSGIPQQFLSEEGCLAFAKELTDFSVRMKAFEKVVSFHPRVQEYCCFGGKSAVEILMENTPDTFQLGLDMYHLIKAGLEPEEWLHRYRGRIEFVHFKDYRLNADGEEELVPVGQGLIDWIPVVRACKETGVKWIFAEQERWQKDAFLCMEESLDFLRKMGVEPD